MGKTVKVSAALMALLEEAVNDTLQSDPVLVRDWRDETCTSKISNSKGGIITLETDHDWKVACAIWLYARPAMVAKLPRDV